MHKRTLIKNATIVNEGECFVGSLLIENHHVEAVVRDRDVPPACPPDAETAAERTDTETTDTATIDTETTVIARKSAEAEAEKKEDTVAAEKREEEDKFPS